MEFNFTGVAAAMAEAMADAVYGAQPVVPVAPVAPFVPPPHAPFGLPPFVKPPMPLPPDFMLDPPPFAAAEQLPIVPPIPDSDGRNHWLYDYACLKAYKNAYKKKTGKQKEIEWLASETKWINRVGKDWKAVKVLGRGGQGVVGHWTYGGPDRHLRKLKDVAVKQSVKAGPFKRFGDGLETEAALLSLFQPVKTQHVLKMYRHMYEEIGQKTDEFDHGCVHRIFLEFCPGGCLYDWLGDYMNKSKNIPEYELWCVFQCLARALHVIHAGTEDITQTRWGVPEICHFDLKLDNVLVGEHVTDPEHRNMPPFKINDFGLAEQVAIYQSETYLDDRRGQGTKPWLLPEQIQTMDHSQVNYPNERPWLNSSNWMQKLVKNPRYGTASNVWQVGMIMYVLMRKSTSRSPNWGGNGTYAQDRSKLECYQSTMTRRLLHSGVTIGCSLDIAAEKNPSVSMYSLELRSLIAECLLCTPAFRPPTAELVQRTSNRLDGLRMTMNMDRGPFPEYEEPQLSQRWYSGKLNGSPADNAPIPPVLNPVAKAFIPTFAAKTLNAGANAFVPGQAPPIVIAAPVQQLGGSPVMVPPHPGNLPGPNPGVGGPLFPVPDPLVVIVLHKGGYFTNKYHKSYSFNNLNSDHTVKELIEFLVYRGVKEPLTLTHGRRTMEGPQKLGEFERLQNIRATET